MNENIIEIEYRPVRKIVILDLLELNNEELFERISAIRMAGQPLFLNWAEEVVFVAIPASTEITEVDENITKGTAYFSGISYSSMPKYKSLVQVGADKVPVVDQSRHPIFKTIAQWLKKRMNDA